MASPALVIEAAEGHERELGLRVLARELGEGELASCADALLFRVRLHGGGVVGYYALKSRILEGGELEGRVVAAVALRNVADLTARLLPRIERQFQGVRSVSLGTNRRGLAAKCFRQGWKLRGSEGARYELVKELGRC